MSFIICNSKETVMTTLFLMMVALVVLWFVISFCVINYDKKMQKSLNAFLKDEKVKQSA